jgi:putative transposase
MHVWQRGNHQETVFASDAEHRLFLSILFGNAAAYGMKVFGYCLMSNHYHLVVEGWARDSISRAVGMANQMYSTAKHRKIGKTGQLWQGRFGSKILDDAHFRMALCYVERNPVSAGLVARCEDWPWSSARAHLGLAHEPYMDYSRWAAEYDAKSWARALEIGIYDEAMEARATIGKVLVARPLGNV